MLEILQISRNFNGFATQATQATFAMLDGRVALREWAPEKKEARAKSPAARSKSPAPRAKSPAPEKYKPPARAKSPAAARARPQKSIQLEQNEQLSAAKG